MPVVFVALCGGVWWFNVYVPLQYNVAYMAYNEHTRIFVEGALVRASVREWDLRRVVYSE